MEPAWSIAGASSLPLTVSLSSHLRELAYIRKHPIEGRRTIYAHLSKPTGPSSTIKIKGSSTTSAQHAANANGNGAVEGVKAGDFLYYSDSDDDEFSTELGYQSCGEKLSCNFADCLSARELGLPRIGGSRYFPQRLSSEYSTRHMLANNMMKETPVYVPNMDKVFCSKWLSHRQVVFGTKCNKVLGTLTSFVLRSK